MKTSNILLAIFIGLITLYFLAAFTEIRISGKRNDLGREFETHAVAIKPFNYLTAHDIDLTVSFGDTPLMSVQTEKGKASATPVFHQRGDTLVIESFQPTEGSQQKIVLSLPSMTFRAVNCTRCRIALEKGGSDSVTFELIGGSITKHSAETSHFDVLRIVASDDSRLVLKNVDVNHLDLLLDNCLVDLSGPVGALTGSMVNATHLAVDEVLDFNFKRDHSSMLNHRK